MESPPSKRTGADIVKEGVCLQEKVLSERCAKCGQPLILAVYKYQSRKLKQVIRCKTCNTASRVK